MKRVCVIPARGGSKRIPRKNVRPFAGQPMIHYAIANARNARLFDRIVISTDDETVAEVVGKIWAEVLWRPAELADDQTGTQAVMKHALGEIGGDLACCLYATTPMLSPAYIRRGETVLRESGKPYAFTVSRFAHAPQRALGMDHHGVIVQAHPENANVNSQDLEPRFFDAGGFYWGHVSAFLAGVPLYANAVGVEIPIWRAIDINENEDWQFAELVFRGLQTSEVGE